MPNEIVDLDAFEVSFVQSPANRKKFILFKSEEELDDEIQKNNKGVKKMEDIKELLATEVKGEKNILKAVEAKEEVKKAMQGVFRILNEYKDDIEKDDLENLLKGLGFEWKEEKVKKEDNKQALTKDSIDELEVSSEVKEQLKELWKSKEFMANQLKKEMEEKEKQEFMTKAEQFENIPNISKDELADLLKSFSKLDEKQYEKLENVLKSANEALHDSSIFQEVGGNGAGFNDGSSYTKIEKMAEPIMKSENITKEQAISRVLDENPRLYEEYLNESM